MSNLGSDFCAWGLQLVEPITLGPGYMLERKKKHMSDTFPVLRRSCYLWLQVFSKLKTRENGTRG